MKHSIRKALLLAGFCLLGALSAAAQPFLRLPAIIGDHMVLQEKTTVKLHGWADPNATLTVTPSWGEAVTVKVGYDTAWSVELTTPAASAEPRSITFATNKKAVRKVDDILIGQVWLCSGQSNMNWSAANGIADMKKELESPMNPRIRLFTVTKNSTPYPQDDCEGRWQVCTPKSALYFSAVGYFFGKRLADELQQPVGLVNSSWGGTPVEVWTPANVMGKNAQMVASWKEQPKSKLWQIGSLYNAMIHPLRHTTFAGAIWYQGESNKTNAALYGDEFTMMIESWRKVFGRTLPFYFVQIAPHARAEGGTSGAVVREQQARVAATVHPSPLQTRRWRPAGRLRPRRSLRQERPEIQKPDLPAGRVPEIAGLRFVRQRRRGHRLQGRRHPRTGGVRRLDEIRPGAGNHRRQKQPARRLEQTGSPPDSRALLFQRRRHRQSLRYGRTPRSPVPQRYRRLTQFRKTKKGVV